jgi:hypothetical protein
MPLEPTFWQSAWDHCWPLEPELGRRIGFGGKQEHLKPDKDFFDVSSP